jgi:hypothetical protein
VAITPTQDEQGDQVTRSDGEHVAEQEAEQVRDVAVDAAEQEDAEREGAGEQDPDGRVLAQAGALAHPPDGEGRAHRGDRGPDVERDPEDVRDHDAREAGVRDGVADERDAAQDDVRPNHRAHDPDERRGDERVDDERGAQGLEHQVQQAVHQRCP